MGLLVQHVSRVLLVCVVMLLRESYAANSAQTSEPFLNLTGLPFCFMSYRSGPSQRCNYKEKIRLKENPTGPVFSFSTNFVASIDLGDPLTSRQVGYGGSARNLLEGFTFAMLPDLNASLGGAGGYLGLLNATSNGDPQSHTFAVEFDFRNSHQFSDPEDGFHIGIDVNSMNSSSWVRLHKPRDLQDEWMWRNWQLQVWIDYDASLQILKVSTADISLLECPLSQDQRPGPSMVWSYDAILIPYNSLSYQIDLSKVLDEHMYVGFTSSVAFSITEAPDQYIQYFSLRTSNSTSPAAPSFEYPCYLYHPGKLTFIESHPFAVKLMSVLLPLTGLAAIYALYKYYRQRQERRGWRFNIDANDVGEADLHKFKELAIATKNFDAKQALRRGGFGRVYKGFLPGNQQYVAVKRVAPESSQGEREFMAEVMIIGKIWHRNLVRLQGWCHKRGELLLVYDYMPQGSLDKHLFGSPTTRVEVLSNTLGEAHEVGILDAVEEKEVIGFPWEKR